MLRLARGVQAERALWTLLLTGALVAGVAARRPCPFLGAGPDQMWSAKLGWRHCADVVFAGDSRVGRGVAPAAVSAALPGRRVLNFAFVANGYTDAYLDDLPRVLRRQGGRPVLVLGITPRSLTQYASEDNGYLHFRQNPPSWFGAGFPRLAHALRPASIQELRNLLAGRPEPPPDALFERHLDGWEAAVPRVRQPEAMLASYRQGFANWPVDPAVIDRLLDHVRRWSAEGIAVYAFRPPTCAAMIDLEDACSGFDEDAFVAAFAAAGGTWIPTPGDTYDCYDGTHLTRESAWAFSRDLGKRLAATAP